MLTDGGARLAVPRGCRPSRLSDDEMVRSVEDSRSPCPPRERVEGAMDGSDNTRAGFGGVARPFLSNERARVDVFFRSVELLRVDVDF